MSTKNKIRQMNALYFLAGESVVFKPIALVSCGSLLEKQKHRLLVTISRIPPVKSATSLHTPRPRGSEEAGPSRLVAGSFNKHRNLTKEACSQGPARGKEISKPPSRILRICIEALIGLSDLYD